MLTARVDAGNGNFERHYIVTGIDEEMLERARLIFEEYHHSGVIQNSHFDIVNITLHFFFRNGSEKRTV